MKIICKWCNRGFERKDLFKIQKYPTTLICEECLWEKLDNYWEDQYIDDIIKEIRDTYNNDYIKWKKISINVEVMKDKNLIKYDNNETKMPDSEEM